MAKYSPSLIQFMSLIINSFCFLLTSCHNKHVNCRPCLRNKICNCIVVFIIEYGTTFLNYLPLLHKYVIMCD